METLMLLAIENYDLSDAIHGMIIVTMLTMIIIMNGPAVKIRFKY